MKTTEIITLQDIKQLVNSFYEKVRKDDLLSPIFNKVIGDRWPAHLEKMYRFWQTILLEEHTYFGSPFLPHAKLPVAHEHFERWIKLFYDNIDEQFTGDKAIEAKWRAGKMAQMFEYKIGFYQSKSSESLI